MFYSSRGNEEARNCDETELDVKGRFLTFQSNSIFLLFSCCFVLSYTRGADVHTPLMEITLQDVNIEFLNLLRTVTDPGLEFLY